VSEPRAGARFSLSAEDRFPSTNLCHVLIDADSYFLELIRYIHLNPVRAQIVDTADKYLWSSHLTYLGKVEQPWVETTFALRLFSDDLAKARLLFELHQ
jgi:putative transposase